MNVTFRDYPLTYLVTYSCGCQVRACSPNWHTFGWPRRCRKPWHRRSHVEATAPVMSPNEEREACDT